MSLSKGRSFSQRRIRRTVRRQAQHKRRGRAPPPMARPPPLLQMQLPEKHAASSNTDGAAQRASNNPPPRINRRSPDRQPAADIAAHSPRHSKEISHSSVTDDPAKINAPPYLNTNHREIRERSRERLGGKE